MLKKQDTQSLDLANNIKAQAERVMSTLNDLEEYKNELEPEEYEEMKNDAEQSLKEFEDFLAKHRGQNQALEDQI